MPAFHTKTIESILEPVAQQVSRLVILHEEAEDGNAMPDLSRPVKAVKDAVDNLVQVGYETCNTSNDLILKQDMPSALDKVEKAAACLLEAAQNLKSDPFSAPARKQLIDGSRGILQGTSALLLTFDESEVRRIIAQCKGVMDYLSITEVVESMDDLVTFVKNISPGLTSMTKQVDDREKELTHQVHRNILKRCIEQIKALTPLLISNIKAYISLLEANSPVSSRAKWGRDNAVNSMSNEIQEIIRVLQLTSVDDDDLGNADSVFYKHIMNDLKNNSQAGKDWLRDPESRPGEADEQALIEMLESASKAAERCSDPDEAHAIKKVVGDTRSMIAALNELKSTGQGSSTQAMALAKGIEENLNNLQKSLSSLVVKSEKAAANPKRSIIEKLQQANQWLRNPSAYDSGKGEAAARAVIDDARNMALPLPPGQMKNDLLELCDETEQYVNQLSNLCHQGMGNSAQAKSIAKAADSKLSELGDCMNSAMAHKVVDDFVDINGPLKALSAAATAPFDVPDRDMIYREKADGFQAHAGRLADTVQLVVDNFADASASDELKATTKQMKLLTPQVVKAGELVLANPNHQPSTELFDMVKQQWTSRVDEMTSRMDGYFDTAAFLRASEEAIIDDSSRIEQAIVASDTQSVVNNASNIARRSNRVLQVAKQEIDNCEDPVFQQELTAASEHLKTAVPKMIMGAKTLSINPESSQNVMAWRKANNELIGSVRDIRQVLAPQTRDGTDVPDIAQLALDDQPPPPRPPLPVGVADDAAPPRPPLPQMSVDPDVEMERVFHTKPEENQPIMLAAHNLHQEVRYWESADNHLIQAAKQMALLMARLSQLVRGEGGSKKDLIDTARAIAQHSAVVTKLAKELASECTDRRMRTTLLQISERIPTIGTQLKILSTVKATMLGAQGSQEDEEATEMLVGNAQNLMQSVRDTVRAAEGASIKIRVQSGYSIRWVRRKPWYA